MDMEFSFGMITFGNLIEVVVVKHKWSKSLHYVYFKVVNPMLCKFHFNFCKKVVFRKVPCTFEVEGVHKPRNSGKFQNLKKERK
jgi:hypothetical protein